MYRKINIEVVIRILIEISIAVFIVVGLKTKTINSFVHPKFNIMLLLSAVCLVVMAIQELTDIGVSKHMPRISAYSLFIIPMIMLVLVSQQVIDNTMNRTVKAAGAHNSQSSVFITPVTDKRMDQYKKKPGEDYIDIDDMMYLRWYMDSFYNTKKFEGMKFRFLARVFKDGYTKDDFVVLGRYGMLCCMADLQTSGFIYTGKDYKTLENGDWYYVTARIVKNNKYKYNYEFLPEIVDVKLEKTRQPTDMLVYMM